MKTLNLNSKVILPENVHKEVISSNVNVNYLPDKKGWPIIINNSVSKMLDYCANEKNIKFNELLVKFNSFFPKGDILDVASVLFQQGFTRRNLFMELL